MAMVALFGGGFLVARSSSLAREVVIEGWIDAVLICRNTVALDIMVILAVSSIFSAC
jgi:hypothetical protein